MTISIESRALDLTERVAGPPLVALWGSEDPNCELHLGTREYHWHRHARGQAFCVESGFVHVRTRSGAWLLPPRHAGWFPPGEEHKVTVSCALTGWSLLVTPRAARRLPRTPCVMSTTDVMRVLVRRAATWAGQDELTTAQHRVLNVLFDELRQAPHEELHLPMPSDRRLTRIALALLQAPDDPRTLDAWARWVGLSPRSLRRLFRTETGLSFAQWRQQAQLTHAFERLARGEPVAEVADALGYASPSNFIAMFRRRFGDSPRRYFEHKEAMEDFR